MPCVMRVSGLDLDIDKLLATVALKPQIIFRKGQSRLNSKPEGPLSARSGATFDVSHADFSQLDQQVKEALFFLETNEEQLFRFKGFPGVDGLTWGGPVSRGKIQLRMRNTPVAVSVSKVGARLQDLARFLAISNSHPVVARSDCTIILLA